MFSVTVFSYRFTSSWWKLLLVISLFTLFIFLGFWQRHRAAEKQHMLQEHAYFATQPAQIWTKKEALPAPYQRIKLTGRYLPFVFLMDNQYQQHRWGYHVLSPFMSTQGLIMIDRGWVAGDITRQTFPQVKVPTHVLTLQGEVYFPSSKTWVLGPSSEIHRDVMIIERFDTRMIQSVLHKSVYPFIIRLGSNEPHGYVREWTIVSMPPARHHAYALQWFAMGMVIFIIYIALSLKKNDSTT